MLNLRVIQTIKHLQTTASDQATEIQALRKEVVLLKKQLDAAAVSLAATMSMKRVASLAFEGGDRVAALGKKFGMLETLWVDVNIFDLPLEGHLGIIERFATPDSYVQGTVAALYDHTPTDLQRHIADTKEFRATVRLCLLFIISFLALIILRSVYPRIKQPAI